MIFEAGGKLKEYLSKYSILIGTFSSNLQDAAYQCFLANIDEKDEKDVKDKKEKSVEYYVQEMKFLEQDGISDPDLLIKASNIIKRRALQCIS